MVDDRPGQRKTPVKKHCRGPGLLPVLGHRYPIAPPIAHSRHDPRRSSDPDNQPNGRMEFARNPTK